ncbi:hypothetical protein BP5796_07704 [Coleophoma crateriformis]|uniref:Mitochondrial division protein 1 n=1 Tax=Coleophoma crateriformis TaxID=565419 RepID=A0A3D8RCG8_9HELO|nr:hypothetical protein BP5796_07704 [Coleophoma crateriformis]
MTVRLWDAATGACQQTLEGHSGPVNSVAFSPDGQRLASASDDGIIQLWDAATGACQQTLEGYPYISTLFFGSDGQSLETNRGVIGKEVLPKPTLSLNHSSTTLLPVKVARPTLFSVSEDDRWIVWAGHKILFLPLEYQPRCSAFREDLVVMGHRTGQVTFTKFQRCTDINQFLLDT